MPPVLADRGRGLASGGDLGVQPGVGLVVRCRAPHQVPAPCPAPPRAAARPDRQRAAPGRVVEGGLGAVQDCVDGPPDHLLGAWRHCLDPAPRAWLIGPWRYADAATGASASGCHQAPSRTASGAVMATGAAFSGSCCAGGDQFASVWALGSPAATYCAAGWRPATVTLTSLKTALMNALAEVRTGTCQALANSGRSSPRPSSAGKPGLPGCVGS